MNKKDINFLEDLLYNTNQNYIINQLNQIKDSLLLHVFAANYNWNSGFNIPKVILNNKYCDFGTGLLMFYYADGYLMLENPEEVLASSNENWIDFLNTVYRQLINSEFGLHNISFAPPLTKVQRFKLRKNNPNIPETLINRSPGKEITLPTL